MKEKSVRRVSLIELNVFNLYALFPSITLKMRLAEYEANVDPNISTHSSITIRITMSIGDHYYFVKVHYYSYCFVLQCSSCHIKR